jgi:plastocyanin
MKSLTLVILSLMLIPVATLSSFHNTFAETSDVIIQAGSATPGCEVEDICWDPSTIEVAVGTTVIWTNKDAAGHTVTSGNAGDVDSGSLFDSTKDPSGFLIKPETTWQHTFDTAGEFPYFCQVHPWMVGMLIVTEGMQEFQPMIEGLTDGDSVNVQIAWTPAEIEPDMPVEFKLRLLDATTGEPINDGIFDFMLIREGIHITHRSLQKTADGFSTQSFTFSPAQTGSVTLRLENVDNRGEAVEFSINVVPEFPVALVGVLMAITFAGAIFAARKYRLLITH